jgi:hypothetical protein
MEDFFRMEPFALFNLLKSLLLDGNPAPSQPNEFSAPTDAPNSSPTPLPQEKETGVASNEATPQENYCLDFIRRHEERAGRRK